MPVTTKHVNPITAAGRKVGQFIKTRRLSLGISGAELARRVGITRANLSWIETGRGIPSVGVAAIIFYELEIKTPLVHFVDRK